MLRRRRVGGGGEVPGGVLIGPDQTVAGYAGLTGIASPSEGQIMMYRPGLFAVWRGGIWNEVSSANLSLLQPTEGGPVKACPLEGGFQSTVGADLVLTFSTSGALVVYRTTEIWYLVVGGGGGGGNATLYNNPGGGAGGLRTSWPTTSGKSGGGSPIEGKLALEPGTYMVTVGNGGAPGENGGASSIGTLVVAQGGGSNIRDGGCGSGGVSAGNARGAGITGQGFPGGFGSVAPDGGGGCDAGAGGGAGGPGAHPDGLVNSNSPLLGGEGIESDITGTLCWYAAGGNGAGYYVLGGRRDIGGGVEGLTHATCYPRPANLSPHGVDGTGSGGGGGKKEFTGDFKTGGRGGKGIVVIRFPKE